MSVAITATASGRFPTPKYFSPNWRSSRSVKAQFIGTWKLMSWKIEQADSEVTDSPLGPNPLGWIMYQPGGRMCVALMRPDRPRRERFIIHHLRLSWFPNWVETDQKRYFEFTGNRLTLKSPPVTLVGAAQVHRVIWERLE